MTVLAVAAGAAFVTLVALDVWLTIAHPTAHGPLSHRVERGTWTVVRRVAHGPLRRPLLDAAGPLAMLATIGVWVGGTWLAYALVYLPFVPDALSAGPGVPRGPAVLEALYVSGTALTTVGFGDLSPATGALRLVAVAQAGTGFAVITGAISYLLSVYPQVSVVRSASSRLADAGADEVDGAAALVLRGGSAELSKLSDDLIAVHQSLRRFPVLYLFHGDRDEDSLLTLVRTGALTSLVLRWGVATQERPELGHHARTLTATLDRVTEDLAETYVGGRDDEPSVPPRELTAEQAADALSDLRAAAARVDPSAVAGDDDPGPPDFGATLATYDGFLFALATRHRHEPRPLLR